MEAELQSLEERVRQLAKLCRQLRGENIELRQTVLTLRADSKRLSDKMEVARARVEALISQLPEEAAMEDDE